MNTVKKASKQEYTLKELRESVSWSQATLCDAIRIKGIFSLDENTDTSTKIKKVKTISTVTISKIENDVTRIRKGNAYLILEVINNERVKIGLERILIGQVTWIIKSDNPTPLELGFYKRQKKAYAEKSTGREIKRTYH